MSTQAKSFADAIKKSRVEVDIDDEMITLERKTVAVGSTQPPLGQYALKRLYDDTELGYEAKYWKRKCEEACLERKALETKLLGKLDGVIWCYDKLRSEKSEFDANSELNSYRLVLRAYQTLTGMIVEAQPDGKYRCTVRNSAEKKATVFDVTLAGESKVSFGPRANASLLPSYLREDEITCDAEQAPVVLRDTLQILFPEISEEENRVVEDQSSGVSD
jgi:hypothetical protein